MGVTLGPCAIDDADALMAFIGEQWSARHILAKSRAVLDWQHRDDAGRRYNFVLARGEANEIVGMLGYIPTSRYDRALAGEAETLWLTTWKVRSDKATGLGLSLLRKLAAVHPATWIGTVGLNPTTRPIYEALGYQAGKLARHYLLNASLDSYQLAAVPVGFPRATARPGNASLKALAADDFLRVTAGMGLDDSDQIPRKTRVYLYHRYLTHPFYRYQSWLVSDGTANGALITRTCTHAGARALRVVDYLGSPLPLAGAGGAFAELLTDSGAEYVDFYCSGLADVLASAGFRTMSSEEGLVLPSYFEPFAVSNVELLFAIKGPPGRLVICKGDADQDRPSRQEA